MSNIEQSTETILFAVTGMSPAVLTETIWALAHETEPVIPQRVVVLTTTEGRKRLEQALFTPREEWGGVNVWEALRYALEQAGHDIECKLRFGNTADDIRVFTTVNGRTAQSVELADLRTRQDNEAAADFLLDQLRGITANPDSRLVASMAGGRKTMGALLYGCMTLTGRDEDRLTHVLVSEPYETMVDFFFPEQPSGELLGWDRQRSHDPRDARIELADVPFVPIRNLFQKELGRSVGRFSQLVASCRQEIRIRAVAELRLEYIWNKPTLILNQQEVRLSEREHLLMGCLVARQKRNLPMLPTYQQALEVLIQHREEVEELIQEGRILPTMIPQNPIADEQDLRRVISDLRTKLKKIGVDGMALAAVLPERGRFSLDMPGERIFMK